MAVSFGGGYHKVLSLQWKDVEEETFEQHVEFDGTMSNSDIALWLDALILVTSAALTNVTLREVYQGSGFQTVASSTENRLVSTRGYIEAHGVHPLDPTVTIKKTLWIPSIHDALQQTDGTLDFGDWGDDPITVEIDALDYVRLHWQENAPYRAVGVSAGETPFAESEGGFTYDSGVLTFPSKIR